MLLAACASASGRAACTIDRLAELPVTMDRMEPMIDVKINGAPVRMMADSGAFFSVISPGHAESLHLPLDPAPFGFYVQGINGTASVSIATVKVFTLAGIDLPRLPFIVGGSESRGAGVIGQNVFGIGDVEYDLPHGAIRLLRSKGCGKANLAYWANGRSYSVVPIEPRSPQRPHTIATLHIDGKPIRATFDTGSSTSILSLAAAARIGIRPDSPGVVDGGVTYGIGRKLVQTWIAPIQNLTIGDGELIQHARIRIAAMDVDTDMLIGADFFIAHRIYVDNANHRLFLTYEGGPVFNIKAHYNDPDPRDTVAATQTVAAATAASPPDAEAESRAGAVAMARRDADTAVADFTKAIALAPAEPRYLDQRAQAYLQQKRVALARIDIDKAIAIKPDDVQARLIRATMLLHEHDRMAAAADLDAVDRSIDPAAMERLMLADLIIAVGQPQRAVGVLDQWIKAHPDDVRVPAALNSRCWARGLAGQDLDAALHDCDKALHARPGMAEILDSRGLVELRRGDLAKAIADYDAVLAKHPGVAWSLYGRGVARLRSGDGNGARADFAAAEKAQPDIAEEAKRYGIVAATS